MINQTQSYEWFDALSRQGSRLSRTSFQTAKTNYSICEEIDDSKDNFLNEIIVAENKFRSATNYRKSVTFKLPEIRNKLDTVCIRENEAKIQKLRFKTAPLKNLTLNLREQPTRQENVSIGSFFEERMRRERKDTLKDAKLKPPNIDSITYDSIQFNNLLDCLYLNNLEKETVSNNQILKTIENVNFSQKINKRKIIQNKKFFTSSLPIIRTFLHKENVQSTESNEMNLENLIKGSKSLTAPLQQIRYICDGLSLSRSNSGTSQITNLNEKKIPIDKKFIELDLPFVNIEDEREFCNEKKIFKKAIFSYLNCDYICCIS